MASVLEIQNLHVSYRSREGDSRPVLSGVNFTLMPGEILGVLGESGSGKSTLAASVLRLLPPNGLIGKGTVLFEGKDLLQAESEELRQIRGGRIALIYQEPSLALHPTIRVGEQVRQVLAAHQSSPKKDLNERTREVFTQLFPQETDRIRRSYPHQLSGGQRQRALIAQAIACHPALVIADEPTAALDPTTQMEILGVFRTLRETLGLAMIFITHNPALLSGFADRVLVLYAGQIVELGPSETVLRSPQHPYTKALFESIPAIFEENEKIRKKRLPVIAGSSSSQSLLRQGCSFEPRCADRMDICRKREPPLVKLSQTHIVSCLKYEE
ncbi:MAG TPA: ABC transporter ATP-binding protein [Candidatus Acidoferrales bacterium]|jgi:peptide/nickel transport system ATP-binding protein|nr:ABC transporter ATP-binding protein [Candidatus Acidoferrales bacterium]